MRSQKFHPKQEKAAPIVVDEASRLSVHGAELVSIYQVDDQGKKIGLLDTVLPGERKKLKLNDVESIVMESKGDFNSVIEGPDKLDTTPIEVPVEMPLTQTQQLRMWLQNEQNMQNYAKQELTWEEFKDLGDMDDGDEFYSQFNPEMTKYEMQAEAMRQESNPNRGNPISDKIEAQHVENNTTEQPTGNTDTVSNNEPGRS